MGEDWASGSILPGTPCTTDDSDSRHRTRSCLPTRGDKHVLVCMSGCLSAATEYIGTALQRRLGRHRWPGASKYGVRVRVLNNGDDGA